MFTTLGLHNMIIILFRKFYSAILEEITEDNLKNQIHEFNSSHCCLHNDDVSPEVSKFDREVPFKQILNPSFFENLVEPQDEYPNFKMEKNTQSYHNDIVKICGK